jgi:integrase
LTWSQVDTVRKAVRLEPNTTKNDEGRTFPYGGHTELEQVITKQDAVRQALHGAGTISPLLFPAPSGLPLLRFYKKTWERACKQAGWPGKVPHDFRRTAVRNLVRAGVAEKTAMLPTGHKTRSVSTGTTSSTRTTFAAQLRNSPPPSQGQKRDNPGTAAMFASSGVLVSS